MSIIAHAEAAIAASKKCATCRHLEATVAHLQAWVEDLRQSRDHWRDLHSMPATLLSTPSAQPTTTP
jgi:hypothetical protein